MAVFCEAVCHIMNPFDGVFFFVCFFYYLFLTIISESGEELILLYSVECEFSFSQKMNKEPKCYTLLWGLCIFFNFFLSHEKQFCKKFIYSGMLINKKRERFDVISSGIEHNMTL